MSIKYLIVLLIYKQFKTAKKFIFSLIFLVVLVLSLSSSAQAQTGSRFQKLADALGSKDSCWSCQIYEEVYKGLRKLVNTSYGYFITDTTVSNLNCPVVSPITDTGQVPNFKDTNSTGASGSDQNDSINIPAVPADNCSGQSSGSSAGLFALATTILAIAMLFKIIPPVIGMTDGRDGGPALRLFMFRILVVFSIFLSATAASLLAPGQFISDFFIDGPLAIGTQIGVDLANVAATAINDGQQPIPVDNGSDFGASHIASAKALLLKLHTLGVAGIITGLWISLEGSTNIFSANIIAALGSVLAGIIMTWTFFMFTITFGLRYLDALIRSMMIFALMPLFVFLWIFDSTRDIAIRALKAGLSLAAVFAVSGVVFTVAVHIMALAFQKALSGGTSGGTGINTAYLQNVLGTISAGGFNFLQGTAGSSSTLNWLSIFILLGGAAMAMACAKMAFTITESLFSLGRAESGIGREIEEGVGQAASSVTRFVRP